MNIFFGHIVAELRVGLLTANRAAGDRPGLAAGDLPGVAGQHRTLCELLAAGKRKACARLLKEHLEEADRAVHAVLAAD